MNDKEQSRRKGLKKLLKQYKDTAKKATKRVNQFRCSDRSDPKMDKLISELSDDASTIHSIIRHYNQGNPSYSFFTLTDIIEAQLVMDEVTNILLQSGIPVIYQK